MRPMTLKPRTTPSTRDPSEFVNLSAFEPKRCHGGLKGGLTAEVVVRLVLRPVDVRRGKSAQVTDSDLECGCEHGT